VEDEKEYSDVYAKLSDELVSTRKECEDLKKSIESKMRERDLLNKDVVDQEDLARINNDRLLTLQNERTKLANKIAGYKAEANRLS